jgi:hypothetical protein
LGCEGFDLRLVQRMGTADKAAADKEVFQIKRVRHRVVLAKRHKKVARLAPSGNVIARPKNFYTPAMMTRPLQGRRVWFATSSME